MTERLTDEQRLAEQREILAKIQAANEERKRLLDVARMLADATEALTIPLWLGGEAPDK